MQPQLIPVIKSLSHYNYGKRVASHLLKSYGWQWQYSNETDGVIPLWVPAQERQYLQQKEREEDEKLQAVLQYTRNTFRQFDFSEEAIFQICECVRYFDTNQQALSVNIHIKRRTAVTLSLIHISINIHIKKVHEI